MKYIVLETPDGEAAVPFPHRFAHRSAALFGRKVRWTVDLPHTPSWNANSSLGS